MTVMDASGVVDDIFRVTPEMMPPSNEEKYKRLHFYVAQMAVAISDHLRDAIFELRRLSTTLPTPELQKEALKNFKDEEFVAGVKELLCVWLHMEVLDQGGEDMPGWLISFFHLTLGAADYMIPKPKAQEVMVAYRNCEDFASFCLFACERACRQLGFGDSSMVFGPTLYPVLLYTQPLRQSFLQQALLLPLNEIEAKAAA
jgi:hypothetical protein